jgi:hypothetical protein
MYRAIYKFYYANLGKFKFFENILILSDSSKLSLLTGDAKMLLGALLTKLVRLRGAVSL